MKYELVCGLETHVELATKTKIFCGCTTQFGGAPNTHCCPVCTGQPGALPILNQRVVDFAIRAGLATHCTINTTTHLDRKNYCYPDLPKAYQISQFDKPLCENGYVELESGKHIRLTRIHIEEDAGKLVHERGFTYIDYNRGGVPLIEIVSEPDISSPQEAREYVEKLQLIMRYIGVSDCKMQEGSMRCDVNISLRPVGSNALGTRTEIKNMNSMSYIEKAMAYEYSRQAELLDNGEKVQQATLRYDEKTGETTVMRTKEDAQDYRYFPEPDILTVHIPQEKVEEERAALPELPLEKLRRYTNELKMPVANAKLLYKYKRV
jgi:aspartyl-tRNA(Asn)/glutamyl-tRNA(Gln) amidotransferase subunit B